MPSSTELLHTLQLIAPVSMPLQERFEEYLREEHHHRKHLLLTLGQICRKIYFIRKGAARAFHFDRNGNECTTWFMGEGDFMISVLSFFRQEPAMEVIELIEDCCLQSISWNQLQSLYAEFPEFNYIGRILTEGYYLRSEERALLYRTKKPSQRYQLLMETHPELIQKVPLSQIASYLGIAQETLSRIRNLKVH